jgi:cytochrome P450
MEDGLHLPQGTKVGTSTYSIHHDENLYQNANVYDALRFSRAREESIDMLKAKNLSTVTTSDTFL